MSKQPTYQGMLWRQFRRNRAARWSIRIFTVLLLIAVLGDFIANEKPIYCKIEGTNYFPIFRSYMVDAGLAKWPSGMARTDWHKQEYERVVFPLIPYSAQTIDRANSRCVSPFVQQRVKSRKFHHWLGTDQIGRDVAAGMIAGTRVALLVGLIAMGIAAFIGIILGALAGYFGDEKLSISRARILLNLIGIYFGVFYGFLSRKYQFKLLVEDGKLLTGLFIALTIFFAIILVVNLLASLLERLPWLGKRHRFPMDGMVMRTVEVVNSIPGLFFILAVAGLIRKPSIFYIMVILGLIQWTGIARFVRSEILRIRKMEYIEAAQLMGLPNWKIIWRHALPNALTPVLITLAFGTAAAILAEATLSFLGIGVSTEEVTWGSLLSEARSNVSAWWLAIVPGLAIFVTVTIFNLIGEGLTEALRPEE